MPSSIKQTIAYGRQHLHLFHNEDYTCKDQDRGGNRKGIHHPESGNDINEESCKKNSKEVMLIAGPYKGINILKNDYIKLKEFGFEELDISFNE